MASLPDEERLHVVALDFEQRQRATMLTDPVYEDPSMAACELIYLRDREKLLLDSHTGCGCEPNCKVCTEKGYT